MIDAVRVIGSNVEVDVDTFLKILKKKKEGFVATSKVGILKNKFIYQVSFDGLIFVTFCRESFPIPEIFELIMAEKIYSPLMMVR